MSLVLAATPPNDPQQEWSCNPPAGASRFGLVGTHWLTFTSKRRPTKFVIQLGIHLADACSEVHSAAPAPTTGRFVGYSERRKLRTSCFWFSRSRLKFPITAFASEASRVKTLPLLCARIASSKSDVRPSCRRKSRCPSPHSGAVLNSLGPACPWVTPSASPGPMSWTMRSEKRFTALLRSAATAALPVLSVGV